MGFRSSLRRRVVAVFAAAACGTAFALAVFGARADAAGGEATLRAAAPGGPALKATIRRDSHGIPNIEAADFAGLGFGYGYAFAQDNICTMAETYVTVRGERSRYTGSGVEGTFGPDGSYPQRGNGFSANNLNSDFFYQRIIDRRVIENLLDQPAPTGPAAEIRQGVRGYVAGYNKYLEDTGVNNISDPRCRGADWVKPISEIDAYRRFYQLALLASGTVAIDGIADEKTPGGASSPIDPNAIAEGLGQHLPNALGAIGSNAYGLGSEATTNGRGITLANPHFPWDGPERFYQTHLTIPGELNVSGGSLYGVPLVLIGHTDNLAWSHTVSTAYRFTPFQETLVPGSPTTYLYDGQPRQMQQDQVTVMVRTPSGLEPRTRTLYSTSHGLVLDDLVGVPLPWTPATAFTMGDVNAGNFRYLNHFFHVDQAQSVDELDDIEKTYQGIPWVNTIASDSSGKAYYADIGAVPNVSNAKAAQCDTAVGAATFSALGLPTLDGSRSMCEWDTDSDAVAPGIFGYSHLPHLFRDDYVTNSNDSYWLSNPEQPLTGFARIIGDENSERSLRTRIGLKMLIERFPPSGVGPATQPLDRQAVQDLVFSNRQYAGELWRDQLVQLCRTAPGGQLTGSNGPVDVSEACDVLADWDLHDNLHSSGAILFREFAARALAGVSIVSDPSPFLNPFNPADPVNTPNGLNQGNPKVQRSLADAVTALNDAGIPLDAELGDYQYEARGSEHIPIHGGPGGLGVFNAINVNQQIRTAAPVGYPNVPHGSSFVMVTQFTNGCPDDRSILTYSQSSDPTSPYFKDQTEMFSGKQWVNPPFCADEVAAANLPATTIEGCLSACPTGGPTGTEPQPGRGQGGAKKVKCKKHKHKKHKKRKKRCRKHKKHKKRH